jgi:hypothetical protein
MGEQIGVQVALLGCIYTMMQIHAKVMTHKRTALNAKRVCTHTWDQLYVQVVSLENI